MKMKKRIQPSEIEVPENDPFKYDQLSRRKPAEILTHLVSSIEGPCVLAVDAPWGTGKTTFLKMWGKYLLNKENLLVINFNAWETDFSGNPFQALSSELTNGLKEHAKETAFNKFKKATGEIFKQIPPNLIKVSTRGIVDPNQLAEEKLSEYKRKQESVQSFRKALKNVAEDLSKSRKNRPLIIVIDELDRCRPPYAVELLEVAKHLFTVENVVFVLAVNRLELENSIKVLYGNDFDSKGYLRRFFDIDFRLPDPDRGAFIQTKLQEIKLPEYFDRTQDPKGRSDLGVVGDTLLSFFGSEKVSLRNVSQALHRLGLVFASLPSDRKSFVISAAVALILRTIDSELYHKFIRGEISDKEVVDSVYKQLGAENLMPGKIIFEAVIILGPKENIILSSSLGEFDSPLLNNYSEQLKKPDNASDTSAGEHMEKVIRYVDHMKKEMLWSNRLGWQDSIDRLELVASDLMDEQKLEN